MPTSTSTKAATRSRRRQHSNPLALAQEWHQRIKEGDVSSKAHLAREIGVSRAHVTQVMSLLHLAPKAQDLVLAHGTGVSKLGIHGLRAVLKLPASQQVRKIRDILSAKSSEA